MDLREIDELTAKLEQTGDITKEEADRLYSLFSCENTLSKMIPSSGKYDLLFCDVLNRWFETVSEHVRAGRKGNFISTIALVTNIDIGYGGPDFLKLCRRYLPAEDLFMKMMISRKTHEKLPKDIKRLFEEDALGYEKYYVHRNYRAGAFESFKEMIKDFVPVFENKWHGFCTSGFKIATGAQELETYDRISGKEEARLLVTSSLIKDRDITPICIDFQHRKSLLAVDKREIHYIKKALEVPFEGLMYRAVSQGIITTEMFNSMNENVAVRYFPIAEFADFCIRCLNTIAEMKTEKEILEREIIESDEWIVTDR